jgi:tRNA(adenine34) deaminase
MGMNDTDWMAQAIEQALKAQASGEVLVGAVLVSQDNQLLGSGFNQMIHLNDPTAHAEILAIRRASQGLQNYRLDDTTLYATLEPCPMCAGAIIHARIKRIVFGVRDFKTGAAGSICNLFHPNLSNHTVQIDEGVLQTNCTQILTDFFKKRR